MDIVRISIKENQRRLRLNRRSIAELKSGRGRIGGRGPDGVRVDKTAGTIALFESFNENILEANRILRGHMLNA
jgi:hypothetical protein